jgi:hypothetical protein
MSLFTANETPNNGVERTAAWLFRSAIAAIRERAVRFHRYQRRLSLSFESLGMRMKLLLTVLALTIAGSAAADCPKATDWARAFYSEHYSFYADAPDPILQLTTSEFGELLKKEWAYSKGEVGHLDYDPWLGQDGETGKPIRFSVETESPDTAVVSMSYPFVLDPKPARTAHGALGTTQARTRVLAPSRFHHSARRIAVMCVLSCAALTGRWSRRAPSARSAAELSSLGA